MRYFDGEVKGGFEEGFNFGFDMWGHSIKKPWRKVEDCVQGNGFKLGIEGGSDNVIFKFSL